MAKEINKLLVFFNKNQSVKSNNSFSPSAGKPQLFIDEVKSNPDIQIVQKFSSLKKEHISIAHDRTYVEGILSLNSINGFSNKSKEVADSLLWTNASFLFAAMAAVKYKTVTMSPTSGFHHAAYDSSGGFCTFNGLMIAAVILKNKGLIKSVGIIDLDAHFGNGTVDIINKLNIRYVKNMHFHMDLFEGDNLEKALVNEYSDCDVFFYQAGADPHIDDPLGGKLSSEQMILRDRTVFSFARKNNKPIVWNLAGGYQTPIEKVLDLHINTLNECLNIYF